MDRKIEEVVAFLRLEAAAWEAEYDSERPEADALRMAADAIAEGAHVGAVWPAPCARSQEPEERDYDESLDGDHETALASVYGDEE
jgi:hypothetical protein